MSERATYGDYEPYGYIRRTPVFNTTILTALVVVGIFVTAVGRAAHAPMFLFQYDPSSFWHRMHFWTVFTYPFIEGPSFFALFTVFMIYWFGIDVERYLGKARFLGLLALLFVVPTLVLTGWWLADNPADFYYSGPDDLMIGLFVAFATFYPNLEYWGWVTMKWLAFAGVFLSAMSYLPSQNWPGLSVMLSCCGIGFGYVRWRQLGSPLPVANPFQGLFRRQPKLRVVPRSDTEAFGTPSFREESQEVDSINPLLDKIAKTGIESLTPAERAKLEKARLELLKKNH